MDGLKYIMPHLRNRLALERIKKKLKFSRVVSIQGARQTGKSVLAKDLFKDGIYVTFDKAEEREEAEARVGVYLSELHERAKQGTIVIDEAQKVPKIFDQIKSIVDENRKPGQFLLLGSTEFSIEAKITESLTGRLSRSRLFPLTFAETKGKVNQSDLWSFYKAHKSDYNRLDFLKFTKNGGFPAIFAIREDEEKFQKQEEWIKLTCERDVLQLKKLKPDPELCFRILSLMPHLEEPSAAELARQLKQNPKRIHSQLKALLQIFAIHRLPPHPLGTGKPLYFLIDPGFAHYFDSSFMSKLNISIVTEFFAKKSYQAQSQANFSYYRGSKGGRVSLLIEKSAKEILAIKWLDTEKVDLRELAIFESLHKKAMKNDVQITSVALAGIHQKTKVGNVTVCPWEFAF